MKVGREGREESASLCLFSFEKLFCASRGTSKMYCGSFTLWQGKQAGTIERNTGP